MYLEVASDFRVRSSWKTASLDEAVAAVQEAVPKDTYAFGTYVPEIYAALGWDTGCYMTDWSDINELNRNYAFDGAAAQNAVLTSVEDATGEDGTDTPASYEPAPELTAYDKYAAVYEQNSDFIGWISIEDTKINYPVMQTPGNKDFYLKHAFDKSYSEYGVPYMQENCKLGLSDNCVIYGHHMQDGSMFADLCKFESEDFYKEHKTIHFDTLAGFGEYEIVCVFKTAAYSADGFKYYHFVDAADAAEFNSFLPTQRSLTASCPPVSPSPSMIRA